MAKGLMSKVQYEEYRVSHTPMVHTWTWWICAEVILKIDKLNQWHGGSIMRNRADYKSNKGQPAWKQGKKGISTSCGPIVPPHRTPDGTWVHQVMPIHNFKSFRCGKSADISIRLESGFRSAGHPASCRLLVRENWIRSRNLLYYGETGWILKN